MNFLAADVVERFYTFLWPMLRISALMITAPIFSLSAFNTRMRILVALVLAWLVYPLYTWPVIDRGTAPVATSPTRALDGARRWLGPPRWTPSPPRPTPRLSRSPPGARSA